MYSLVQTSALDGKDMYCGCCYNIIYGFDETICPSCGAGVDMDNVDEMTMTEIIPGRMAQPTLLQRTQSAPIPVPIARLTTTQISQLPLLGLGARVRPMMRRIGRPARDHRVPFNRSRADSPSVAPAVRVTNVMRGDRAVDNQGM